MADQRTIIRLLDTNLNTPPATPTERFTWHTGAAPTGPWTGQARKFATYLPGTGGTGGGANDWLFEPVLGGQLVYLSTGAAPLGLGYHLPLGVDGTQWGRVAPLDGIFIEKTADQALTNSLTDVVTWATVQGEDALFFTLSTGVLTVTSRDIAQLDVDVNVRVIVTTGPAPVSAELVLLLNGAIITTARPGAGMNSATAVEWNMMTIKHTLYDLVAGDTLKLQALHDGAGGGAASIDGDCCTWRCREYSRA